MALEILEPAIELVLLSLRDRKSFRIGRNAAPDLFSQADSVFDAQLQDFVQHGCAHIEILHLAQHQFGREKVNPPPGLKRGSIRHSGARRRRRCPAAALSEGTPQTRISEAASVPSDRSGGQEILGAARPRRGAEGNDGDSGRILRDESATKVPEGKRRLES